MPFTLAHPAAILPFRRWFQSPGALSALVIGSISPDLVYFFALDINSEFSHSILGMFLFCLPASLVVLVVFHIACKQPLNALFLTRLRRAPEAHQRLGTPRPVRHSVMLLACILIGAFSHLVWDDFTHADGFAVQTLPLLRITCGVDGHFTLPAYRVLQYASSVFGLVILACAALRQPTHLQETVDAVAGTSNVIRMSMLLATTIAGAAGLVHGWQMNLGDPNWEHVAFRAVVDGMKCSAAVIGLFILAWHVGRWTDRFSS